MSSLYEKFINITKPILISGESGTGKSCFAKKLFENSTVHKERFLTLHLASIKEELIESELFGHQKGAFTGALSARQGYFESVGKGTLFIDEVGELSLEAQKKLLYVLEEKKYVRVGDVKEIPFYGRIIMATNKNLSKLVSKQLFREDLYFRLICFHLRLPALRENQLLLNEVMSNFIRNYQKQYHRPGLIFSNSLMLFLQGYSWPGNYRQLKNVIEFIVAMAASDLATENDLPLEFHRGAKEGFISATMPLEEALVDFEKKYIYDALVFDKGNLTKAAHRIGMNKSTLIYRVKKLKINAMAIRAQFGT